MRNLSKSVFIFVIMLFFTAGITFTSCNKKNDSHKSEKNTTVITATFYPLYIMLLNITEGAQDITLKLLAPGDTGCLHDYQLTTKDMAAVTDSDIIIANGSGMEDFLDKVLSTKNENVIVATDGYPHLIMDEDEANAHIWVSTQGAQWMINKITHDLCLMDKKNESLYISNSEAYINKIKNIENMMSERLSSFSGRKIITFHEAFPYFARQLKLETSGVIEREPGTVPSPKELEETVKLIKDAGNDGMRPVLFAEPQYSSSSADIIAAETGCTVYELDPCVTGPLTKEAYINAMLKNIEILEKAFK